MPLRGERLGPHFLHHPELQVKRSPAAAELTRAQRAMSLAAVIAAAFGVGLTFGIGAPLTALTFESWQQPKWLIGLAGAHGAHGLQLR